MTHQDERAALIAELEDEARVLHGIAIDRGNQDATMSAMLADRAAALLARDGEELARLEEAANEQILVMAAEDRRRAEAAEAESAALRRENRILRSNAKAQGLVDEAGATGKNRRKTEGNLARIISNQRAEIRHARAEVARLRAERDALRDVRQWFHYPIEMPVTSDGKGPATVGQDAAAMTYEVWDQLLNSHASFDNLPDAINEAMRLNTALAISKTQGENP